MLDAILVVTHLITALTPLLLVFINRKLKKTEASAASSARTVEEIHVAVNSERAALLHKVEALRDEILSLTTDKAVRDEQDRNRDASSSS